MVKINLAGVEDIIDNNYRYKMEKIEVNHEKNKTVLVNIETVASDLNRDVDMMITFFKKYFGCNFTFKKSKCVTPKKITAKEFQEALKEFIEYSIICPSCRLPETHINTHTDIVLDCDCCGAHCKMKLDSMNSKVMKDMFLSLLKKSKKSKKKNK